MRKIVVFLIIILNIVKPQLAFAETQVYRIAGDNKFPPYEHLDSDGVYKGFNVDILKAISLVTGIDFEFLPMNWEDAYLSIDKGQADIIQGIKESEDRKRKFLFTNSLLVNSQSIFVLEGNRSIISNKDLSGKLIGLNKEDSIYNDISKIKDVTIVEYNSIEDALQALLDNKVEVMIGNTLTVNHVCKEKNAIDLVKIVGDTLNESKYGKYKSRED